MVGATPPLMALPAGGLFLRALHTFVEPLPSSLLVGLTEARRSASALFCPRRPSLPGAAKTPRGPDWGGWSCWRDGQREERGAEASDSTLPPAGLFPEGNPGI